MTASRLIIVRDNGNPFTLERFGVGIVPNIGSTGIGCCHYPLCAESLTILFTLDYENRFSLYELRQVVENPPSAVQSWDISAALEPFLKEILGSSSANAVQRVSVLIGVDISMSNGILWLAIALIRKEVAPFKPNCINNGLCRATSLTLNEKFSVGLGEAQ